MGRREFYLHQRNGIFYAELIDPKTGSKLAARSTRKRKEHEAYAEAFRWLHEGIPTRSSKVPRSATEAFTANSILEAMKKADLTPDDALRFVSLLKERGLVAGSLSKVETASILFLDFLETAWDPEHSAYIKEKAVYGQTLTLRHIGETQKVIKRAWNHEKFKGVLLGDVTRTMLKEHLLELASAGFAPSTLNKMLAAVSAPLNWAAREKIIPASPAEGIRRFSGESKTRGILSQEEIQALASLEWEDGRAKIAFLVALTCGLRLSEVNALQSQDIGEDRLYVRHSWSFADGLTCLKNKESREVKVLPSVRDALRKLVDGNPHPTGGERFVFFCYKPNQPLDKKVLTDGYLASLHRIGVSEAQRKTRNLVFHGLRHNYATALSERVSATQAMKSTGHRSSAMFAHYAAHQTEESLDAVGQAVADAFGRVVAFPRVVG